MSDACANILDYLSLNKGFSSESYRKAMLGRRIENRMIKTNHATKDQYYKFLQNDKTEADKLIKNFLIHVSSFFRDALSFEYLERVILPELLEAKQKGGSDVLRIWSAGSARGEEAYSMAILLLEHAQKRGQQLSIEFFASDCNSDVLQDASTGIYPKDKLMGVKLKYLEKYFTEVPDGYKINNVVKQMVRFVNHNLLDEKNYVPRESIFGNFDIVMCRNVMIYFNEEHQKRVFSNLHRSLSTDGILFLGDSESPFSPYREVYQEVAPHTKLYRKR